MTAELCLRSIFSHACLGLAVGELLLAWHSLVSSLYFRRFRYKVGFPFGQRFIGLFDDFVSPRLKAALRCATVNLRGACLFFADPFESSMKPFDFGVKRCFTR
jgi:hypothetical protein